MLWSTMNTSSPPKSPSSGMIFLPSPMISMFRLSISGFPPYNLDLTRSWCFQKMCEHCRDVGMRQVLYSPPIVLLLTPSKITWLFGNLDRRPRVCGPRGPRRNTIVSFIIKLGMVLFGLSLCLELESGKQESKGRKERRSKSAPWRLCHIVLRATAVLQMLLIFIDLRESSSRTASSHSLCVKPLFTTPGETGDMCHNFCLMDGEAEVQSKAVTMSNRCMIPKSKDGMGFNHLCSPISRNIVDALKVLFVEWMNDWMNKQMTKKKNKQVTLAAKLVFSNSSFKKQHQRPLPFAEIS